MRHMPKSYSQIHVDNQNVLWAYLPNSTLSQVASFSTFQLQTLPYCAILQPTDLSDLVWHCSLLLLWIPKPFCESSWVWQVLICLGQSPEHVWYVCLYVSLVLNQCTVLLYIIIISVVILYHYHSDYQCHCFVILIIDMCNILSYDWYDEICTLYPISMYFIFWSLRIQLYAWAPDTEPKTWAQGKDIALTLDSLDLKMLDILETQIGDFGNLKRTPKPGPSMHSWASWTYLTKPGHKDNSPPFLRTLQKRWTK